MAKINWTEKLQEELLSTSGEAELRAFCKKTGIKYATAERHRRRLGGTGIKAEKNLYYEKQIQGLQETVKGLLGQVDFQNVMKDVAQKHIIALPKTEKPIASKGKSTGVPEIANLLLSDLHIGEIVSEKEMGGINAYDFNIFARRMEFMARTILSIKRKMQGYQLSHLEVHALGDMVTGIIHDELVQTSEDSVVEWTFNGALVISQFLSELLTEFDTIHFTGVFGNHGRCLCKQTEILTNLGYKKYNEIKKGDWVATLNLKRNKIEWQKIEKVTINDNEPVMYYADTKSTNLSITPDHTLIVYDKYNKKFIKKLASDVWGRQTGFSMPTTSSSGLPDYEISNDLLKLMAWIITDGGITRKGNYFNYKIYQSKEKYIDEIESLLNRLGINFSKYINNRQIKEIAGKKLKSCKPAYCFNLLAENSQILREKLKLESKYKFPAWMSNLSDRQVKLFLVEAVKGNGTLTPDRKSKDGYIRKPSMTIWGTKEQLDCFQGLLVTHNISCSITEQATRKGSYYLQVRSNKNVHITNNRKNINFKYNDLSWCVSVKNKTLLLRKNGKPFIAGNTTQKVHYKRAYVNWDYILYQTLAIMMVNNPRITFDLPQSFWTIREVGGRRILLLHGSSIKSWSGIPWYGIQRAVYKLTELLTAHDKPFSDVCLAHFHNIGTLGRVKGDIRLNGSVIGGNEFSVGALFHSTQPNQLFYGINPQYQRNTWEFKLQLDDISKTTGKYKYSKTIPLVNQVRDLIGKGFND